MEIRGKKYRIIYDPDTATITCEGTLRLYGAKGYWSISEFEKSRAAEGELPHATPKHQGSYSSIIELLYDIADQQFPTITLNLYNLESLNSSGVNVLSKFVLRVKNHQTSQLIIQGNSLFLWQTKVLHNLQKLMPELQIEWK